MPVPKASRGVYRALLDSLMWEKDRVRPGVHVWVLVPRPPPPPSPPLALSPPALCSRSTGLRRCKVDTRRTSECGISAQLLCPVLRERGGVGWVGEARGGERATSFVIMITLPQICLLALFMIKSGAIKSFTLCQSLSYDCSPR